MRRCTALVLAFAFSCLVFSFPSFAADGTWGTHGPFVDEILMPVITDPEARLLAMLRGEIDIYPDVNRPSDIRIFNDDPRVELTMDLGFHMYYMAFNLQQKPLDDPVLRRAMAHLVDREAFIFSLYDGFVLPLAEVVPESSPFHHPGTNVAEYDPERADQMLNAAGYVRGTDGIRIDPHTGRSLAEMALLTPTFEEEPTAAELGVRLAKAFQDAGIPVVPVPLDFNTMIDRLLRKDGETGVRNYDLYMAAWGLSRFPTHLYTLFHSDFDVDGGNNTPGLRDADYDAAAEKVWTPRDLAEAMQAAYEAQEIWADLQPYVPLYSGPYLDAFRSEVTGYVPHRGYGAASNPRQSPWTALNIRRLDQADERGGTIRWLLTETLGTLNVLVAYTAYEDQVLGLIYDSLITVEPQENDDYPWLATSWETDTWTLDDGREGSVITYHLAEGVTWHDGVPFTAHDVKFTMDYLKQQQPVMLQGAWRDYSHATVHDDTTVSVYYKTVSYWHTYNTGGFLAEHIWRDVEDFETFQPWREPHPEVEGLTMLIGHGPFVFKEWVPGEYVRLARYESYWRGLDLEDS